jgi:hypothetical protein
MPHSKSVRSRISIKSKTAKSKRVKSGSSVNMYHFIEACKNGHTEVLKQLLPTIDINGFYDGKTPLIIATIYNRINIIPFLIKHGADVNLGSEHDGTTPIDIAVKYRHMDAIKMLLKEGADLNKQDNNGEHTLFYAIASMDTTSRRDDTYYSEELMAENSILFATLLQNGADTTIINKNGDTALDDLKFSFPEYPDEIPFLLLSNEISPEYVIEFYNKDEIKDLYKYVSASPEDSVSPRTTYHRLTRENEIMMIGTDNPSPDNIFRIKIPNITNMFTNYRNLSNPNRKSSDCGYQMLFALGLLDRDNAVKGSKSVNIALHDFGKPEIGLNLGVIRKHICKMFDLKDKDLRTGFHHNPEWRYPISPEHINDFFDANLENNMATFVRIAWEEEMGHFIVVFKDNNEVSVFDPQRTAKTKDYFSHKKPAIFPINDIVKQYTLIGYKNPAEIYEYDFFYLKKNKKFPNKPLKAECSFNLPLDFGGIGGKKTRKGHKLTHRNKTIRRK